MKLYLENTQHNHYEVERYVLWFEKSFQQFQHPFGIFYLLCFVYDTRIIKQITFTVKLSRSLVFVAIFIIWRGALKW